ncbi:unnamed protein product [marine sediment metagenome]|uniref:Uncharacterized protein n=1 Tax=marine sediment metagenome TaxID=412755 RepID=X1S7G9_9ZZZZ
MPRGYPDYGVDEELGKVLMPTDIAETAARLGSINTYDRRGSVLFQDDFEAPVLKWIPNVSPATAYWRFNTETVKSGSQSLHIHTDNVALREKYVAKIVSVLNDKLLGFEISFSYLNPNCNLQLKIHWHDGGHRTEARLKFVPSANSIYVLDNTPADVPVAGGLVLQPITPVGTLSKALPLKHSG